jgi:hypothetical protein
VVRIRPIKSSFWDRIDGSISLGASYTRASEIGQGSLSVNIGVRRPKYEYNTKFDTTITVQPNEPDQARTVDPLHSQTAWNRGTCLDRELKHGPGLTCVRRSAGVSAAISSSRTVRFPGRSAVLNEENLAEGESSRTSRRSLLLCIYHDTPKTNISTNFLAHRLNVSDARRVRPQPAAEIVKDFTVGVTA